jgi:hypothetical protein
MKQDFAFKGKWLVRYEPGEFTYPEILTLLPPLQTRLEQQGLNADFLNISFSRTVPRSRFFQVGDHLFVKHNGSDMQPSETDPGAFAVQTNLEALARPIQRVDLLFPRLQSDPRWKTMGLPAAQLFLASALQASGFSACPRPLDLPAADLPPGAAAADMIGFTLFEDLLPAMRDFLAGLRRQYQGIIAAGGPLLTLAPLAALYHLPQIELAVRGEAELVLPGVLKALNQGDVEALFSQPGIFWQRPGLVVLSAFDRVNRPETFKRLAVDLSFLQPGQMTHGLEMNFSRGCKRGCVFCCRVQGAKFRKLPLEKTEEILTQYEGKLEEFSLAGGESRVLNINDDDILQDPAYAAAIFALIKKHGWRIHGVQTSPASLLQGGDAANPGTLDQVADRDLYVDGRPLLWLGTDVFLESRARRLGKRLPAENGFRLLLGEFEKRGLRHFHYWISSDGDSTWQEIAEELALIIAYHRDFPGFALLAHAPFTVPYPASALGRRLARSAAIPAVKIREEFPAPDPRFAYVLVERLETAFPNLNRLLNNEKAGGTLGFFGFLKEKDFKAAAQLAYYFLKQEELQGLAIDPNLARAREKLEKVIGELLELPGADR